MKRFHVLGITLLLSIKMTAQKVYSVEYQNQVDVNIFVVEYENQVDLKVFKVKDQNLAD